VSVPPHDVTAEEAGHDLRSLLSQVEREVDSGQMTAPADDNALQTWERVVESAYAASPETLKSLAEFATHIRNRSDGDRNAGRLLVAIELSVFADQADILVREHDVITSKAPATAEPALPVIPEVHISPRVVLSVPSVTSRDPQFSFAPPRTVARVTLGSIVAESPPAAQETAAWYANRGDTMVTIKDVSAARKLYEFAADAGSARAATSLAKTYEPFFLHQLGAVGLKPDAAMAAVWYRKAAELGDAEAQSWLLNRSTEAAK
jgi:hypothetical protein